METTFIVYINSKVQETIIAKIDMNRAIDIVTNHYNIAGYDNMYAIEEVVCIDLVDNTIEVKGIIL